MDHIDVWMHIVEQLDFSDTMIFTISQLGRDFCMLLPYHMRRHKIKTLTDAYTDIQMRLIIDINRLHGIFTVCCRDYDIQYAFVLGICVMQYVGKKSQIEA